LRFAVRVRTATTGAVRNTYGALRRALTVSAFDDAFGRDINDAHMDAAGAWMEP